MNRYQHIKSNIFISAAIIALLQFTHALEYMMVGPLFKYISDDLGLPIGAAGYVTGAYTAASVVSGVVSFLFIDRLDKKRTLTINLALLAIITAITPFSPGLSTLLILRILAGLVGGITLGIGLALLLNRAPPEIRGRIIAIVVGAFSAVSLLGLPLSLYLAEHLSWHAPFWLIAAICVICLPLVSYCLPEETAEKITRPAAQSLSMSPAVLLASVANAVSNFAPFVIIPILVPILINLTQIPSDQIPLAFFVGGLSSYIGTHLAGRLADKWGALWTGSAASLLYCLTLVLLALNMINGYWFMILFMFSTYMRIVSSSVMSSYFPDNAHRAGFNLLQTAQTNLAATVAFFIPATLLGNNDVSSASISTILHLAIIAGALLPLYLWILSRILKRRAISQVAKITLP